MTASSLMPIIVAFLISKTCALIRNIVLINKSLLILNKSNTGLKEFMFLKIILVELK